MRPDTSWCRRGGSRGYVVVKPIVWHLGKKNSGFAITIPVGREFESSVPKLLRRIWSAHDPFFLKAAAIHDYLLEEGFFPDTADSEWLQAGLSENSPRLKTEVARTGMRMRRLFHWIFGANQ